MKKFLSILLVAMLIISMIPATVSAATELTLSLAKQTYRTSYSTSVQVYSNNGITLTNNKGSGNNIRDNSSDDHARFYQGSTVTVECANMTKAVFTCTSDSYATALANSIGNATASGSAVTVTFNPAVDSFTSNITAQTRVSSLTVTVEEGGCEHTNKIYNDDAVEADCTTPGQTASAVCDDCGETIPGETIDALGHNYVNGVCDREGCGAKKPSYVLTSFADIKDDDLVVITVTKDNTTYYAMTNGNGTGSAPAAEKVAVSGDSLANEPADTIIWKADKNGYNCTFYVYGNDSAWLYTNDANNGVRVGTNDNKEFSFTDDYLKNTGTSRYIGVYNDQDWRCYTSINNNITGQTYAFYVSASSTPVCAHANTTTATVDATCTVAGSVTVTCDDCGDTVSTTELPATGHKYENGICVNPNCGAAEPSIPAVFYIATIRSSGNYFYMTGAVENNRYTAVDSGLTELPASITAPEAGYVFQATKNADGTYLIEAVGIEDGYVGWSSDNSGLLVAEASALKLTLDANQDGTYSFHFAASDGERYLSLNGTSGNDYFAFYKGTQKQNLALIPAYTVEADSENYATVEKALEDGKTTLKPTGTVGMDMDVTAGGTRYIGLADGEYYTYHALDLKLTGISLRSSEAGIYYRAQVTCDDTLAAAVDSYGIMLSTEAMPTELVEGKYTKITGSVTSGAAFNSGSVFNIFNDEREASVNQAYGAIPIYANVYLEINGQLVVANTEVKWSLKDVLVGINSKMKDGTLTLETAQSDVLYDFYQKWTNGDDTVINEWGLDEIAKLTHS